MYFGKVFGLQLFQRTINTDVGFNAKKNYLTTPAESMLLRELF